LSWDFTPTSDNIVKYTHEKIEVTKKNGKEKEKRAAPQIKAAQTQTPDHQPDRVLRGWRRGYLIDVDLNDPVLIDRFRNIPDKFFSSARAGVSFLT
jgi:hypothetical protein